MMEGRHWVLLEDIAYVSSPGENISGNRDYDLTRLRKHD